MTTEIIPQRNNWDCGLCCLAMAMGIDYDEALSFLPVAPGVKINTPAPLLEIVGDTTMPFGLSPAHTARILLEEGIATGTFGIESYTEAMAGEFTPLELHSILNVRTVRAIIFMETATGFHGHAIYWDGVSLIDPARGVLNSDDNRLNHDEYELIKNAYAVVLIYESPSFK